MNDAMNQLVDKLHEANNILVTVSRNPSVDQLAACLGLTLTLNKFGKHATAVFSGVIPSTLEFLKPEETIEKTTDSLRDFIIALDKSKADKLRYKVEDDLVRIFITPYRTSLSADDLDFSQGDFNVDAVVALGVTDQNDFDEAITAHGRILHDAAVISINAGTGTDMGSVNWSEPNASSLSELVAQLAVQLDAKLMDEQIATALLTGIVAETARFSNEKTSPQTMSVAATLMSAGANQQLVASKLDAPEREESAPSPVLDKEQGNDTPEPPLEPGAIAIKHDAEAVEASDAPETPAEDQELPKFSRIMTEPPERTGQLTASTEPEALDPANDPLGVQDTQDAELLSHDTEPAATPDQEPEPEAPQPPVIEPFMPGFTPPPPAWVPPSDSTEKTLSEIEAAVGSVHLGDTAADAARQDVEQAFEAAPAEPVEQIEPAAPAPNFDELLAQAIPTVPAAEAAPIELTPEPTPIALQQPTSDPSIQALLGQTSSADEQTDNQADDQKNDPNAPPPVPPPIPFNFGGPQPPASGTPSDQQ